MKIDRGPRKNISLSDLPIKHFDLNKKNLRLKEIEAAKKTSLFLHNESKKNSCLFLFSFIIGS